MELSRTSLLMFFLAALNLMFGMYSAFNENWLELVLTMVNFFVMMFSFASIENAVEAAEIKESQETWRESELDLA